MKKLLTNIEKISEIIKEYFAPVIMIIVGFAVSWALMSGKVTMTMARVDKLEIHAEEQDDCMELILQRLIGIDTKLEYIIKELDK